MEEKSSPRSGKKKTRISVPGHSELVVVTAQVAAISSLSDSSTTFYTVKVATSSESWVLLKRFSQFKALHDSLSAAYIRTSVSAPDEKKPALELPLFPPKATKLFRAHDAKFLEERRALLDNYLQKLLENATFRSSQLLLNFLISDRSEEAAVDEIAADLRKKAPLPAVFDVVVTVDTSSTTKVIYEISCRSSLGEPGRFREWKVHRRFGDFMKLESALVSNLKAAASMSGTAEDKERSSKIISELPPLPPKESKILIDHHDADFIETRRVLLQNFLRKACDVPELSSCDVLLEFLDVPIPSADM